MPRHRARLALQFTVMHQAIQMVAFTVLVDSSGTYHAYAAETLIMAAIDHLNEQLVTLPGAVFTSLEGLYPEFGDPHCGPDRYLASVEEEITRTGGKIEQAAEDQREPLQRLLEMLEACATALRNAGV